MHRLGSHAVDGNGRSADGWPLATGAGCAGAMVATDLDADGTLDFVAPDRFGRLYAYRTGSVVNVVTRSGGNQFTADAYLGFEPSTEPAAIAHFYRVPTFESIGGRALAESVANEIRVIDGFHPEVVGMRLPILRETKMPAVLVTIGSARAVSDASNELVEGVLRAFEQWISRVA